MLTKLYKPRTEGSGRGFTIIEVMIVLAIAGLILLIVFLAVPALQRNSRNTSIKNDASNIAGAISTYESDNNGSVPTGINGTGTVTVTSASGNSETAKVNGATTVATVAAQPTKAITVGTIDVYIGKTCSKKLGGSGVASARAISLFYTTESTSGNALQCLDS